MKIIKAYGGKLEGKTRLFKTYYFAHLEYFRAMGRTLTDGTIIHMPHGPGLDDGVLGALHKNGHIRETKFAPGSYAEFIYELLADVPLNNESAEDKAIHKAVAITKSLTATQLSDMTHVSSHSWNRTTNGQLMDICLDAASNDELAQIKKRLEAARKVAKAFHA